MLRICNAVYLYYFPIICGFAFHGFTYPQPTALQKYYMEN